MIEAKKIEIVIEQVYIQGVLNIISRLDISGYTLIKDVIGSGDHGVQDCQDISEVNNNCYFMVITSKEKSETLIKEVRLLFATTGGMMALSDIILIK